MNQLLKEIKLLQKSPVRRQVEARLREFSAFESKGAPEWFSELCFCILTANSKAATAINIQCELGSSGFKEHGEKELRQCILRNKHRFYNNKARFIVEARKHANVKEIVQQIVRESGEEGAREWLVRNVKGLGYKEASHFLRNVGYTSLAILDRHILGLMQQHGFISERPKSLNKKKYLGIEEKFRGIAKALGMSPAELDLYMWHMKTGKVLK
ncbi:MAG: N-glycosylase/DNA lyase [Candidatus Diapherotrites archaeon]|nr:N-glycosylase/DNA lyase [Candidatus Diapherotrites archaeon]